MERAEINTLDSAYNIINNALEETNPTKKIGEEDAKMLKAYMKKYIQAD